MGKKTELKKSTKTTPAAPVKTAAKRKAAPAAVAAPAKKTAVASMKPLAKTTPAKPLTIARSAPATSFSSDDIALRAYFIAEKRRARGLPGDEHQDWIEAERQLRGELTKPAKKSAAKKATAQA